MDNLIKYVEQKLYYAEKKICSTAEAITLFHSAFGAIEFFITLNPNSEEEVTIRWEEEWMPRFKKIINDKYM